MPTVTDYAKLSGAARRPVTTASDVYCLAGAFEPLSGMRPFAMRGQAGASCADRENTEAPMLTAAGKNFGARSGLSRC
jgi:hypothetical protein